MKWIHLMHAAWAMVIPLIAVYVFFTKPGMDWRISAITAVLMLPFIIFGVVLYKVMFRKKLPPSVQTSTPVDIIDQARRKRR